MKKILLLVTATVCFTFAANAQNIIIQQNNQSTPPPPQTKVIVIEGDVVRGIEIEVVDNNTIRIENYNSFNVECNYDVLFRISSRVYEKEYPSDPWKPKGDWHEDASYLPHEEQKGTKILKPNVPFVITRKQSIPETIYTTWANEGKIPLMIEYRAGKSEVKSIKCYKF